MENQHRKITGYRELTEVEINQMNLIKHMAEEVGRGVKAMQQDATVDARWVDIAKTDLQKGFMALTRAIAKPESF